MNYATRAVQQAEDILQEAAEYRKIMQAAEADPELRRRNQTVLSTIEEG
ncbi:MAG TPA: hypothetical protein VI997_09855 [Candidatus Thermoplasmatota archaeon]|nr:hypothetical protein [Candidatus Thermoplasmatota archaeon]